MKDLSPLEREKPDWEELVKTKRPENDFWKGCSNQGEMIGYAIAVVQLKKKLLERIDKCNDNLSVFHNEPISLAVKRELEAILSDYYDPEPHP